jgi:hypothetical protein
MGNSSIFRKTATSLELHEIFEKNGVNGFKIREAIDNVAGFTPLLASTYHQNWECARFLIAIDAGILDCNNVQIIFFYCILD